jgi:predicted oxidoreductase
MKTYRIPNTDLQVSRIAYGSASLGGGWDESPLNAEVRKKADRAIHSAHDNGITLFDHSDAYCRGKSESVFGEVLRNSPGLRQQIVIQSKCGMVARTPKGYKSDLTCAHITRAVEESLRRLETDYLDILLLHLPSPLVDPQDVARAFDELHRDGKVRYFGVSNHTPLQIQLLKGTVRQPIIANQVKLGLGATDLFVDGFEFTLEVFRGEFDFKHYVSVKGAGTLDYCRLERIQLQAYSPMAREILNLPSNSSQQVKAAMERLKELAQAKSSTPTALAIAWLLHHPAGIVPVIGATNPEHIVDNCGADHVTLSDEEWYSLLSAWADIDSRAIVPGVLSR